MSTTELFDILTSQLRDDESLRLDPYLDTTGNITIGYGRNLSRKHISKTEAEILLSNDARDAIEDSKKVFSNFEGLSIIRQSVIANMIFNMGLTRFLTFKKLIEAIEAGNYKKAAFEMMNSKWAQQVKHRAVYLAELMEKG